jgi:dephospho-CoA kinase
MLVLGLTGSIGMGKSVTAGLFIEAGVPVHDADAAVHRLYEGAAVPLVESAFPGTTAVGKVDRNLLATRVLDDAGAIAKLEAMVHPLVREMESAFLRDASARGHRVVVLEVPLLFETGGDGRVDAVVVVSAPPQLQQARVLGRPGVGAAKLEQVIARQLPDAEKRRRAHFVVDTSRGVDSARSQVRGILRAVAAMPGRLS